MSRSAFPAQLIDRSCEVLVLRSWVALSSGALDVHEGADQERWFVFELLSGLLIKPKHLHGYWGSGETTARPRWRNAAGFSNEICLSSALDHVFRRLGCPRCGHHRSKSRERGRDVGFGLKRPRCDRHKQNGGSEPQVTVTSKRRERETMGFTKSTAMRHKRGGWSGVTVTSGRDTQKDKERQQRRESDWLC